MTAAAGAAARIPRPLASDPTLPVATERGLAVVVDGDRVQELGADVSDQCFSALLDQAQAEVDVAEQTATLRLPECRVSPGPQQRPEIIEHPRREGLRVGLHQVRIPGAAHEHGEHHMTLRRPLRAQR